MLTMRSIRPVDAALRISRDKGMFYRLSNRCISLCSCCKSVSDRVGHRRLVLRTEFGNPILEGSGKEPYMENSYRMNCVIVSTITASSADVCEIECIISIGMHCSLAAYRSNTYFRHFADVRVAYSGCLAMGLFIECCTALDIDIDLVRKRPISNLNQTVIQTEG
jgi:hypothetical protein